MDELQEKLFGNHVVEEKMAEALSKNDYRPLLEAIQQQIGNKRCFLAAIEEKDSDDGGRTFDFRSWKLQHEDKAYLAMFTSVDEIEQGPPTQYVPCDIRVLLDIAYDTEEISGVAINPWGRGVVLEMNEVNILRKNSLLHDAIRFATEKHEGQYRKGTVIPYIVHPIETMQILNSIDAGMNLLMAGVLHDTLEDTPVTESDLRKNFGDRITDLVIGASEPDKSLSWEKRKEHTLNTLQQLTDTEQLMVICADKLSNITSIANDLRTHGDTVWSCFNRGYQSQKWYYCSLSKIFEKHTLASPLFSEYINIAKQVFD